MSSLLRFAQIGRSVVARKHVQIARQPTRKMGGGDWTYRETLPKHSSWTWNYAAFIGFMTVFWITYMSYNHFSHITGEYPQICPEKFTDEELGIPPDDEDVYPEGYVPLSQRS